MGRFPANPRWFAVAVCVFVTHALVSSLASDSFALTSFADITQTILQFVIAALALRNAIRSRGQQRAFWVLMTLGFTAWFASQVMWSFYEIALRQPVPEPFSGDVVLFLHVVPFMAALVFRPHRAGEVRRVHLPTVDFFLLFLWWMFLYVFTVIPWQLYYDRSQYSVSFNLLYIAENMVWLIGLCLLWKRTHNEWRFVYANLFIAGALYLMASQFINAAILAGNYYTGSLYDLPLVASMLWFIRVNVGAEKFADQTPKLAMSETSEVDAYVSRAAMLAILSLPLLAAWTAFFTASPETIGRFRLAVSLSAMLLLALVVFAKQYLLDRERMRLLAASHESYGKLKRLQAHLVQSEKLAALGQLVSGAAHEINNPLTAILGYAELINTETRPEDAVHGHARKIKQQVHRTKDLVVNLLRFARQSDSEKTLIDLNNIVADTLQLRDLEMQERHIEVRCELANSLPPILADQTQLLDVCFQLVGNAMDAVRGTAGGLVTVRTRTDGPNAVLEVLDNGPGISDPSRVFDPFYTTKGLGKGPGLGLSACYGIVQGHQGEITCHNQKGGGAHFIVKLPFAVASAPVRVATFAKATR